MSDIIERKIAVRKELKNIRGSLEQEYRYNCDRKLFDKTVACDIYTRADILLAYYPIKSEPNIVPIIEKALEDGKLVAMPISDTNTFTLTFKYIRNMSD